MLQIIENVVNPEHLKEINRLFDKSTFVDGKLSAGKVAKTVKNNEEMNMNSTVVERLNHIVMGSLLNNETYRSVALPHRVAVPFYARYTKGMYYGSHVDDPVMGPAGAHYRTDLSTTVFLNEPQDYEGGELVMSTATGESSYKLAAGSVVVYPSNVVHHVSEVSSGERRVAVTWVQSMIRSAEKRDLLYELNLARSALSENDNVNEETSRQVDNTYVNLMRMWSEI